MNGILLLIILFSGVFVVAEILHQRGCPAVKTRKFVHISSGIVSCLLPIVVSQLTAIVIGLVFSLFLLWTKRARVLESIHNIQHNDVGAILFPLGLIPCAIWFWDKGLVFQSSALILGFSDGFACIFGRRYGKRGYNVTGYKTLEGSFVFFVTTMMILVAVVVFSGMTMSLAKVCVILLGSLVLTAVEGALGHGWDNLFIPISAAIVTRMVLIS